MWFKKVMPITLANNLKEPLQESLQEDWLTLPILMATQPKEKKNPSSFMTPHIFCGGQHSKVSLGIDVRIQGKDFSVPETR